MVYREQDIACGHSIDGCGLYQVSNKCGDEDCNPARHPMCWFCKSTDSVCCECPPDHHRVLEKHVPRYDATAWQNNPSGFIPIPGELALADEAAMNIVGWANQHCTGSLLDIGCCDGRYIRWLRSLGFSKDYTGVDITPAFIAAAEQQNPEERFLRDDCRSLSKIDCCFNMVICPNVLMHLDKQGQYATIKRMAQIAEKYIAISVYGTPGRKTIEEHQGGFLNYLFPITYVWKELDSYMLDRYAEKFKEDFYSFEMMPLTDWSGFDLVDMAIFKPELDRSKLIFQYLFMRVT